MIKKIKNLLNCMRGKHEWEIHYTDSYKCEHCNAFEDFPEEIYGEN